MGNTDWLKAVAIRAGVTTDEVNHVLTESRIYPAPVAGSPRRLMLCGIHFSGAKFGIADDGPFKFSWKDLDRGLYAMLTDGNFKGKTSVIEVVKWMLRGRLGENLQEDVRSWIHECTIRFEIDGTPYEIRALTREGTSGELLRLDSSGETRLASFSNENEFEAVMSDFFMKQFSLGPVTRWQGGSEDEGGMTVVHGWPALAGAMFIGTNYASLLGDVAPTAGIATPLMQMYLGLPWISTLTAAKSAQQAHRREQESRQKRRKAGQAERHRRIDVLTVELEAKRKDLSATLSDEEVQRTAKILSSELVTQTGTERKLLERVERESASLVQLQNAHADDRRELQAHLDSQSAAEIFRMLDPSFCPRCDGEIDDARKRREKLSHECSVCGENIATDENAKQLQTELEHNVKETGAALNKARRTHADTQSSLVEVRVSIAEINAKLEALTERMATFGERRRLETEVAVLEARIAEAGVSLEPEESSNNFADVLDAAVSETDQRVKAAQAQLLEAVSEKLVVYAKRFGMIALSSANLRGNVTLPLVKGGKSTTYSKVTPGEKLRLKVATVLAMISVAESKGVGRHPGMLMIDSPGAQEVSRKDLEELAAGLEEISEELNHLQVFVAGVASDAIKRHVPTERVRYADGDQPLW